MSEGINLKEHYSKKIKQALHKKLGCNVMSIPKLLYVVINMGGGAQAFANKSHIVDMKSAIQVVSGGRVPIVTKTKKSNAGFKIREGWPIGVKVTLRNDEMWDFVQRLVFIAMPRIRDFRGITKKSFDGRGNYSIGINDHSIFPEVGISDKTLGLDITFVTSATNDDDAYALLSELFFPFKEKINNGGNK